MESVNLDVTLNWRIFIYFRDKIDGFYTHYGTIIIFISFRDEIGESDSLGIKLMVYSIYLFTWMEGMFLCG